MIKWLLRDNPALLGDILEESASGRSTAWICWQVFVAVARSIGSSARQHPVLMLRGVATGIVVYILGSSIVAIAYGYVLARFYKISLLVIAPYPGSPLEVVPFFLIPWIATGWVVARTHRACAGAAITAMIILGTPGAITLHPWIWIVNIVAFLAGALIEARQRERST